MKKLLAVLSIVLFVLVGCQESSSIVAPENDSALDKDKQEKFVPTESDDDDGTQDNGGGQGTFPRI